MSYEIMSDIIIKTEGLSKAYHIKLLNNEQGETRYKTLQDDLLTLPKRLLNMVRGENSTEKLTVWALKDVSLEIKRGEVLGIIGRNGSGKSTLLKVLSRITEPTCGYADVYGRMGSLLEVGTGFHPELTGRENVYLSGAILGMRRNEIKRKFDEIVAFAEVENYIDTPVKRYSSGMYVRLAFAVAAHLETEILLVDEVLAVGDINFQKKCMGKMGTAAKEGRTVLFVSHNLASVSNLCTTGVVLENGRIVYKSTATDAVVYYTKRQINREVDIQEETLEAGTTRFISARILDQNGHSVASVQFDEPCVVEMVYEIGSNVNNVAVPNFHFNTAEGISAFAINAPNMQKSDPGIYVAKCHVPKHLLNEGTYTIGLALTEYPQLNHIVHFFKQHYLALNVQDPVIGNPYRYGYGGRVPGVIRPVLKWEVKRKRSILP